MAERAGRGDGARRDGAAAAVASDRTSPRAPSCRLGRGRRARAGRRTRPTLAGRRARGPAPTDPAGAALAPAHAVPPAASPADGLRELTRITAARRRDRDASPNGLGRTCSVPVTASSASPAEAAGLAGRRPGRATRRPGRRGPRSLEPSRPVGRGRPLTAPAPSSASVRYAVRLLATVDRRGRRESTAVPERAELTELVGPPVRGPRSRRERDGSVSAHPLRASSSGGHLGTGGCAT